MGIMKRSWESQQEALEYVEKATWIREYLQDEEVNEFSDQWSGAEQAYDEAIYLRYRDWTDEEIN